MQVLLMTYLVYLVVIFFVKSGKTLQCKDCGLIGADGLAKFMPCEIVMNEVVSTCKEGEGCVTVVTTPKYQVEGLDVAQWKTCRELNNFTKTCQSYSIDTMNTNLPEIFRIQTLHCYYCNKSDNCNEDKSNMELVVNFTAKEPGKVTAASNATALDITNGEPVLVTIRRITSTVEMVELDNGKVVRFNAILIAFSVLHFIH